MISTPTMPHEAWTISLMQAPIVFKPNKNSEIDVLLAKTIKELKITLPIAHIKESCYLIGSQRVNLMLKRE